MSLLRKGRVTLSILGSRAIHLLVSVIQAEIARNQLSGMLGGNSLINMAVHEQSLYLPLRIELELESKRGQAKGD